MKFTFLALILSASLFFAGCASQNSGTPLATDFVVTVATMKVIEGADDPLKKARKVVQIAEEARAVLDGDAVVLVSELETRVMDSIEWEKLKPSDYLLAATLIETVSNELKARAAETQGFLQPEQKVIASEVLDTIIGAANRYAALAESRKPAP